MNTSRIALFIIGKASNPVLSDIYLFKMNAFPFICHLLHVDELLCFYMHSLMYGSVLGVP